MKQLKEKKALLDYLRQTPIVELACKRANLGRTTFYRWKKEDKEFAKAADEALFEGEKLITDMSESQLITLIKEKNFPAIQLWLKTHHPKYANKVELSGSLNIKDKPLTPEQEALIKEALRLAALPDPDVDGSKKDASGK